jgi:hypothetical protein
MLVSRGELGSPKENSEHNNTTGNNRLFASADGYHPCLYRTSDGRRCAGWGKAGARLRAGV